MLSAVVLTGSDWDTENEEGNDLTSSNESTDGKYCVVVYVWLCACVTVVKANYSNRRAQCFSWTRSTWIARSFLQSQ